MFLLTLGPNLYYVDPSSMVLKGQVPFGLTLKAEAKNFKNFHVHTVNNYYCRYFYIKLMFLFYSPAEHITLKIPRDLH